MAKTGKIHTAAAKPISSLERHHGILVRDWAVTVGGNRECHCLIGRSSARFNTVLKIGNVRVWVDGHTPAKRSSCLIVTVRTCAGPCAL